MPAMSRRFAPALVCVALALGPGGQVARAQTLDLGNFFGNFGGMGTPPNLDLTNMVGPSGGPGGTFAQFRDELWREAREQGITEATFERAFAGVAPDPEVLAKATNQAEFVKPIWEYLQSAVSDQRIATGREMLARHRGVLDEVEARYGVSRHVVVAIWGLESTYGEVLHNPQIVKPVIRSLATLAYLDPQRRRFGRNQLIAALRILENGDTSADRMMGSWAGAMGHTQFIPTTYLAYAVDFDGDGRRDIWDTVADALASTANYLKASGWQAGQTWGYEVTLPDGFDYGLSSGPESRPLADWRAIGVTRTQGRGFPRGSDAGTLVLPAGAAGPAFLMLKNFRVIKRYNSSDAYALAVGHLADRLRGGEPFAANWPRGERPLLTAEREEMQRLLTANGFDPGGVDGNIGPQTRSALRAYQSSVGLTPDGFATQSLLDRLRNRS